MNILYITDTGGIMGGGELSLLGLLENLDRNRFKAHAAVPYEGELSSRLASLGIAVFYFPYMRVSNPFNILHAVSSIKKLCAIIRQEKIDLVHTNSTGGIVLLAGIAARMTRTPLVSHVRLIYTGFWSDLLQGILSTKIVCICERIKRKISFLPFSRKIAVIYNGVNLEKFKNVSGANDFRKEIGCGPSDLLVGAAGTYTPGKGFEYLIQAQALLRAQLAGLKVVIMGFESGLSEEYLHYLEGLAKRLGLGDGVKFLRRRDDIPRIFSSFDLFVFTSLIDPFGRVIIEAMASAKPVVAFNWWAAAEIIVDGETGLLARPADAKQLAEKMKFLLLDKAKREQFGSKALARCREKFDINLHARNIEQLYLQVLRDESVGYLPCVLCGNAEYRPLNTCVITPQDAGIAEKILTLCRCSKCGLVYVNPQLKITDELYCEKYFNQDYMKFYSRDKQQALQSNEPFAWRLALISKHKKQGNLLDIGCATGEFLNACRDQGWQVCGIDISDYAIGAARRQFNLEVKKGNLEGVHFADKSFDVISAGDILEHTQNPLSFLRETGRILKDGGILYLALPDFGSFHYQLMSLVSRFNHKNYFVLPHHLYHFTRKTLRGLLRKADFIVVEEQKTESRIQEQGIRRFIMRLIFGIGRFLHRQDRIVIIAAKSKG